MTRNDDPFVLCNYAKKRMASGKMPIGAIRIMSQLKTVFLLPGYGMSFLSILGDTADFGRIKKERFPLLPLLKPARNRTEDATFQLQTTICERGLYLGYIPTLISHAYSLTQSRRSKHIFWTVCLSVCLAVCLSVRGMYYYYHARRCHYFPLNYVIPIFQPFNASKPLKTEKRLAFHVFVSMIVRRKGDATTLYWLYLYAGCCWLVVPVLDGVKFRSSSCAARCFFPL
jgi:hypothetical protein